MKRFCCVVALLLLAISNNSCARYQINSTNYVMCGEDTLLISYHKSTQTLFIQVASSDLVYDAMLLGLSKEQFHQFRDCLRLFRVLYAGILDIFQEYEQELDPTKFSQGNFLDILDDVPLTVTVYFCPFMEGKVQQSSDFKLVPMRGVRLHKIRQMHQSSDCNLVPVLFVDDDGTPYFGISIFGVVDDKDPSISVPGGGAIVFKSPEEIDDFIKKCYSVLDINSVLMNTLQQEMYGTIDSIIINGAVQPYLGILKDFIHSDFTLDDLKYFKRHVDSLMYLQ